MAELKSAKANKKSLKCNITKFKEKVNSNIDNADIALILMYEAKIASFQSELKIIFDSIFSNCEEKDLDEYILEKETIIESLDELSLIIKRKSLIISSVKNSENNNDSRKDKSSEIKLPKLTLPTFNGKSEEWLEFQDLFSAAVHKNPNLTSAQKLQYLKSSCKADALAIIHSISICDANYEIAWNLLTERYSNKKELVNSIIKRMLSLPSPQDTSQAILKFVDNINECLRMLNSLEQNVAGFSDTLILYILVEKLGKNSRTWWERNLKKDEIGSLEQFTEFLKDHARSLINSKPYQRENEIKRSFNSKVLLSEVKSEKCVLACLSSHPLYNCPVYKNMSVAERVQLIKSRNRCFRCLMTHKLKECRSKINCFCNKPHHTSLHFPREQKIKTEAFLSDETEGNSGGRKYECSTLKATAPAFNVCQQ